MLNESKAQQDCQERKRRSKQWEEHVAVKKMEIFVSMPKSNVIKLSKSDIEIKLALL